MRSDTRLPRALTTDLVIRELDDETLVYDTKRDDALCLNETSALVWKQCDGKTTAAQAAQFLQSQLNVVVDTDVVWLAVKQLERSHLVEGPSKSPSVTRRALMLKYAPAALALPVIMSITTPAPAGASSCVCPGPLCVCPNCCPGSGFFCNGSTCQLG